MEKTTLSAAPRFPEFKRIELADRDLIHARFQAYAPEISELTFTNLFIWRHYYQFQWSLQGDILLILAHPLNWGYYLLAPVGGASRAELVPKLLDWLCEEKEECTPRIERADARLIRELGPAAGLSVEPAEDQFDYVYATADLINLTGRRYHAKKNHINRFSKNNRFEYRSLTPELAEASIHVLKRWCDWRECEKSPLMRAEFDAVHEALLHFVPLELGGGAILVEGEIMAFALGERLNPGTAVIHAEKAAPNIPELFAMINQQVCAHEFAGFPHINREQDLGEPGLRRAKRSYHPVQMVEKYRIKKA
ncbi:MAG TPA: DUF2156 domain-containing protein [bacterium]|nr:DUF2156 domain-containing protein [bacterium]